jgi:hypothetical protein
MDPDETARPATRRLPAPAAIFIKHAPTPEADRLAEAILKLRPGALIVAPPR